MSSVHSVSQWIASLKEGELASVQKLWDRFKDRLIKAAKQKLGIAPKVLDDEDDISQSVLVTIWQATTQGRFDDVRNRDELWWTLLKITKDTIAKSVRHEYAKKRAAHYEQTVEPISFEDLIDEAPSQEFVCILEDLTSVLLKKLRNNQLRKIAKLRIYGYTSPEISARLSIPQRSAERKLQLIRNTWSKELEYVVDWPTRN
jgi:DNA-directed RNA polymerase specialized sigma24 family protein